MHLRVFSDTTNRTLSFFHLILYTSLLTLYYVKAWLIESIHQDNDRCETGSTVVTQHQMSVEFYLQEYTATMQGEIQQDADTQGLLSDFPKGPLLHLSCNMNRTSALCFAERKHNGFLRIPSCFSFLSSSDGLLGEAESRLLAS